MRLILIFLFFLPLTSQQSSAQIAKGIEPGWKNAVEYSNHVINSNEVSAGTYILLHDTQIHVPLETYYNRITKKITDNVGIQDASTINISYDPSYQKLVFHKINVIRDGYIIDKLNLSNFQEMRRELNAESYLYDGSLSAVMNISDVRTDDIIDFSYSIIGFNPIHKGVFSTNLYMNDLSDIGTVNISVLSKKKLLFKTFNNTVEPKISKSGDLFQYNWNVTNPQKIEYEDYTPVWALIYDSVFITEYESWDEVVDWGVDIYNENFSISNELQDKITEINQKHTAEGNKIKATLDFVQNDVRYLGLESGIGGYKPFSPNLVYEQRFGDCKDKSLLMVTMLNEMGIEAYPMLVNTYLKQNIKELVPSPLFFDHCVVKVVKGSYDRYYDPTITNQGGDYDSTHFPDYRYGLVIKKGNDKFDEISPYSENKVETFEEYTIDTIGKGATLKVTTVYHEGEADNMRNYFKNNSMNSIKKEFENFYSSYYFNVSSSKDPITDDEKLRNIFKVYEEYQIDSIWQPMPEHKNTIAVNFIPGSLISSLYNPTKAKRKTDISVPFPILREHHIKVNLPMRWDIANDKLFVNSPGFYYEWKADYDRNNNELELYYYLKTLKDHIKPEEYKRYIQDYQKVNQSSGYSIFIPKNYKATNTIFAKDSASTFINTVKTLFKIGIFFALMVVAGLLIYWYSQKRKKT